MKTPVPRIPARLILAILLTALFCIDGMVRPPAPAGAAPQADPDQRLAAGVDHYDSGRYARAVEEWEKALSLFESAGNVNGQADVRMRLGDAYEAMGKYPDALDHFRQAFELANAGDDQALLAATMGGLGKIYRLTGDFDQSRHYLELGLGLAESIRADHTAASILNNYGNLLAVQNAFTEARKAYAEGRRFSENSGDSLLTAKILLNLARLSLKQGNDAEAPEHASAGLDALRRSPDSRDKAFGLIAAGQIFSDAAGRTTDAKAEDRMLNQAIKAFTDAETLAKTLEDDAALSYARGSQGRLYETRGRYAEALTFTREAVFAAQKAQVPESLYRWEWQAGRLLKREGDIDGAISSYRLAVHSLQAIRQDLALGCNKGTCLSFRDAVGPVFFELADLLLQRAARQADPDEKARDLMEARATVEKIKAAELQDYFQDECVTALKTKETSLDQAARSHTAVIYPILLPERTELLVSMPDGMKQFTRPIGSEELTLQVRLLRQKLEQPLSRYERYAEKLYDWLIRPLESELTGQEIDTLVFVPDGPLRTIPMTALRDGAQFLVEKYAVVTTPGLTLTDPRPLRRDNVQMLLNGITEPVQGFDPLPNVSYELKTVKTMYDSQVLQDAEFTRSRIEKELNTVPYTIVHIASHGQFDRDPKKTFLLTHDDKLTMDNLEKLIRLSEFREDPVELLTLSACQTAVGDDRAALGLAGVAVKAGARTALATLWFIDDETTSRLVSEFYSQLKNPDLTKAKALQTAQVTLMNIPRFSHPAYWAPFLLIGNWL